MKQIDTDKQPGKNKDLERYFKSALEHVVAAGHGIQEFSEFALDRLGDAGQPHLRTFIHDVRTGVIENQRNYRSYTNQNSWAPSK